MALNREGTGTAALFVGSHVPVFLVLGILHVSRRFFAYESSSEKLKMKNTYHTKQVKEPFFFLVLSVFLHDRNSAKNYTVESLGATGKCWKLQRKLFL